MMIEALILCREGVVDGWEKWDVVSVKESPAVWGRKERDQNLFLIVAGEVPSETAERVVMTLHDHPGDSKSSWRIDPATGELENKFTLERVRMA